MVFNILLGIIVMVDMELILVHIQKLQQKKYQKKASSFALQEKIVLATTLCGH